MDYTYIESDEWKAEVEDLRVRLAPWGPWTTLELEVILLQTKYPVLYEYCHFFAVIDDLIDNPDDVDSLNFLAKDNLKKNQILTTAGARIYYGGLAKALQNYQNELLRSPEAYIRNEEEWWLDAEAKPALLHIIADPLFVEWFKSYRELDLPKKIKGKIKRKVVEDLTAKLKPYSGKIQKKDEIGNYTIDREKHVPTQELENIGESTVDSAFDFTYDFPKNQVKALAQKLLKLSEFDRRLVLTEHGQTGKNSYWKKKNTIKVLSEESGISESALRQRKKRKIDWLKENVTNDES